MAKRRDLRCVRLSTGIPAAPVFTLLNDGCDTINSTAVIGLQNHPWKRAATLWKNLTAFRIRIYLSTSTYTRGACSLSIGDCYGDVETVVRETVSFLYVPFCREYRCLKEPSDRDAVWTVFIPPRFSIHPRRSVESFIYPFYFASLRAICAAI